MSAARGGDVTRTVQGFEQKLRRWRIVDRIGEGIGWAILAVAAYSVLRLFR